MPRSDPTPPRPQPLTNAARIARGRFERAYQKNLEEARRRVALTVLVWGPNPASGSPAALKRVQIRERLLQDGHWAIFSEDVPQLPDGTALSEKEKEFAQLQAADMAIILVEDAPGASAEAHDFTGFPSFASKCYVFIPTKYRAGYSANGAIRELDVGFGGVHWYEPDELASCNVLTMAVQRVEVRRQLRYRQEFG